MKKQIFLLLSFATITVNNYLATINCYANPDRIPEVKTESASPRKPQEQIKEIHVRPGEEFELTGKQNGGTGYQWQAKSFDDQFVSFINKTHTDDPEHPIPPRAGKHWVGGAYLEVFHFKALKDGVTEIVLENGPAWDRTAAKPTTYKIIIDQQAPSNATKKPIPPSKPVAQSTPPQYQEKQIQTRASEKFTIAITDNEPGKFWDVRSFDTEYIDEVGGQYIEFEKQWHFKALKPGITKIVLDYGDLWNTAQVNTYTITIE
jgi:predicted secreted protein